MNDKDTLRLIADRLHTTTGSLRARDQQRISVAMRGAAIVALRKCRWSYPRIGRALNRDHSTVMAKYNTASQKFETDGLHRYVIGDLIQLIRRAEQAGIEVVRA